MGKVITDEEREKRMAEDIWLNYFNRYLYESNTISEKEYKRMTEKIAARKERFDRSDACQHFNHRQYQQIRKRRKSIKTCIYENCGRFGHLL